MKNKWIKAGAVVGAGVAAVVFLANPTKTVGAGQTKVTICHKGQTLEVAEPAVQAHIGHGDTLGPCNITPTKNQ